MAGGSPHLVILGLMGVGKSTTGRAAADALGWEYVDSDADIERLCSVDGREIAASQGTVVLHRLESAVLLGALAREEPAVVTAAASTVEDPLVQLILPGRALVVRLDAPLEAVHARQRSGGHRRPMSIDELEELAQRREPHFRAVEDLRLDADRPTDALVASIVNLVRVSNPGLYE